MLLFFFLSFFWKNYLQWLHFMYKQITNNNVWVFAIVAHLSFRVNVMCVQCMAFQCENKLLSYGLSRPSFTFEMCAQQLKGKVSQILHFEITYCRMGIQYIYDSCIHFMRLPLLEHLEICDSLFSTSLSFFPWKQKNQL